ncbi:unnamed protein product [Calypogeia fissa]
MGFGRPRSSWQRIVSSLSDAAPGGLSGGLRVSTLGRGRLPRSNRHSVVKGGAHPIFQDGANVEGLFLSRFSLYQSRGITPVSAWRNVEVGFALQSKGWTRFCPYSSVKKDDGDDIRGPVAVDYSSLLDEDRFHELADDILHHLQDKIEVYGEDLNIDGFDSDYSSGVLTLRLGDLGTYVINKQTPNRQIWLSSPVSGPGRFDWSDSKKSWIYRRNNVELVSLLEKEFSELLGATIDLA